MIREEYSLEYGTDCIEMHVGAIEKNERVVIVDDLIATGGTLGAAIKLLGLLSFFLSYLNENCFRTFKQETLSSTTCEAWRFV